MKKLIPLLIILLLITACQKSVGQLNNQGNEAFNNQDYQAAQEIYQAAQLQDPDVPEPYYNAANTYYRQEDYEKAQFHARQALREADDTLAQHSFYNLGNTYYNNEQFAEAAEAYKEALRLDPTDQAAKHNLELALKKLQEQEQQNQQNQQNQNGDEQQEDQQNQSEEEQQEQEQAGGQNQEEEQSEEESEQNQSDSNQPEEKQSHQESQNDQPQTAQPLTEQQARQILDSIADNTETLQEHLQQILVVPGSPPEKDW